MRNPNGSALVHGGPSPVVRLSFVERFWDRHVSFGLYYRRGAKIPADDDERLKEFLSEVYAQGYEDGTSDERNRQHKPEKRDS